MNSKNANRPGYKKTKVGWVPQEWDVTTLESIAFVERGKFSVRPRNDPRYYGGQYPFLQTGDVSKSDGRVKSFSQTLNEDGLSVSKLFPANTLLITIAANIGDVAEVPFEFACPDSLVAVQANEKSDRLWLKYFLHTRKSYFESKSTQNAQANINLQTIRPVAVQLPSLPEQEAIAGVLECWDRGIGNLELKIRNKRRIKKGLMQQLLSGKRRLPGFGAECRISNSEYGIPKDWKVVRLEQIGDFYKGAGIAKSELSEKGVPCIRYGEIYTTDDFVIKTFRSFISKELAAQSQRINQNDLLFAGSGETAEEIGKSIAYMKTEEAYAGGDIVILSTDVKCSRADYLSAYFNTAGFRASEEIYALLLAGRAVSELIDGRRVSPQMKFIDWKVPANNTFHVCAEFELSENHERRPDIVLFVNGIPFAVIECKRASVQVAEAVTQMIRNQGRNETPRFFLFPQLLIVSNVRKLKYGTMLTPAKFYTHWKEKDADPAAFEAEVSAAINKTVEPEVASQIVADLCRGDIDVARTSPRAATEQDKGLYSLLMPGRMLDLVRNFVLYDGGIKKVARYQQYFAIRKTIDRLKTFDEHGRRRGGLIWHTQGSGKSLTMVMLVKCLIDDPDIVLPRVLVVTDRKDLDKQIADTFAACSIKKDVKKTTSSKELMQLIRDKDQRVITALIHKFEAAKTARDFVDDDPNVFVLIDEAHRSQAGKANTELNLVLPRACQIAFTGTPLMKKEKSSAVKYGGVIDAYTISEAEADGVVLPLIYQPRFAELEVKRGLLDKFYDQLTQGLSEGQKKDFQQKFNSPQLLEETSQRIETIALDIMEHYQPFIDTGLKAQVVAPSKYAAVLFQKAFELCAGEMDVVRSEVIVSDTNDSEADDQLPEHKKVVAEFLADEKHRHGTSLDTREKRLVADFKDNPEGVRILIVVDKLLTGFDAPRNTFLYLAKQLKDHNLLQAIARVNRLFDGDEGREAKVNGFVIDYSRNGKNLRDAMQLFTHYDPDDVDRALLNTDEKIQELEKVYQELRGIFNGVRNPKDTEEYLRVLEGDLVTRERFYELVNEFIKQFAACCMLYDFTKKFDPEKLHRYQTDLKKFLELKKTAKAVNAESVDFSKYIDQIRRILDKYVSADYEGAVSMPAKAETSLPVSMTLSPERTREIESALAVLSPDDYDQWLKVGMSIHSECPGMAGFNMWQKWSILNDAAAKYDEGDSVNTWLSFGKGEGITIATLFKMARGAGWKQVDPSRANGQVDAKHTALVSVNADAWMASDPDPVDAVVSNLFDTGDKVCIIGPSKSFKTFFTLQLAISIAAGREFLNWNIPKPRRVLMVQLEVKETHFHGRVRKVWSAMGISTLDSRFEIVNGRSMGVVVSRIAAKAGEVNAEIVVIDPIYKLLKGDENSARDWKPLLAGFDQLAETGVAVVYVHHDAKGAAGDRQAQDRGAGSGILARDYDCALTITPHATGGALKVIEAIKRNYPSEPAFTSVWEDGKFVLSDKAPLAMTSRSSNKNPTTDQPLEDFLEHVTDCLGVAESGVLNKGSLTDAIRGSAGLTIPRSTQLIELAVEQDVIVSNHGKGLSRKQVLYAIDQSHLDSEIGRLNAITSGKQK